MKKTTEGATAPQSPAVGSLTATELSDRVVDGFVRWLIWEDNRTRSESHAAMSANEALRELTHRAEAVPSLVASLHQIVVQCENMWGEKWLRNPQGIYETAANALSGLVKFPDPISKSTVGWHWHIGRSWVGSSLEDNCPCGKAPCGLVDSALVSPECEQHALGAARTMRQMHQVELCPSLQDAAPQRPPK